ncbi:hypothetical protein A2715_02735 [Candidatus Woesebacteria bacterium RIFCSPHIGHO2_01_FULL_39_32]|uniref:Metallo-beta-lactamase domain-containing protein n=1 Tax=Candidatus Woesebacteria bacterium RIFCSPLOWO2_01_FULL_39_25 TaxID=1802521 RepID=A0A1F8BK46_9BACT|nr:MAG: hypothetical protein A2124_01135 [Candidatus Woesebacteria bacterium GWB1_37_5]OGM24070.1 MAG: hypothetical protein A2715_02735 [Candidatus Woesebacteria bacterium RIFCSPHIGHO2_01_FULL_39_32]OGM37951.1 MAG: hypothetical protein A3F01_03025 [Candidatus Woesebacteria bacterium RIFCSPHIGHO2_12_FULL_38_11]OGM64413.1 MAG: hypothetical protein A2893_00910 [Candidatus Woesebacteria bacterium RIFCSPLOWO2_01_FULL_39_25]
MPGRYKYLFIFLLLITALVWITVLTYPKQNLRLIACDVGQGDSILAIYGKTQILIDGGPDKSILDCLSQYLPFWDRELEVVVNTHPQKDHYMGLIEVFKTYGVDSFVATPLDSSSKEYGVLKELVGSKGIRVINPQSGQRLRIGLIYLDILHPSQEFLATNLPRFSEGSRENVLGGYTSKKDPNDFSVVTILRFGEFDALLTGDISQEISDVIAEQLMVSASRTIDYLKVPHHGSKNGLTQKLLDASNPEVAVISSRKNNSYGHPHEETLKLLRDKGTKLLRTDEMGDVGVESDGKKVWVK